MGDIIHGVAVLDNDGFSAAVVCDNACCFCIVSRYAHSIPALPAEKNEKYYRQCPPFVGKLEQSAP